MGKFKSRRGGAQRAYQRTDRLNEVVREVIADELSEVDHEELRILTITGVDVNRELDTATVYFTSLDVEVESDGDRIIAILDGYRPELQEAIANQLRMRKTPVLSFRVDPAILEGRRIDALLDETEVADNES